MTIKTDADLKTKFETGKTPTYQDFVDLIESKLSDLLGDFPNPLPAVSGEKLTNLAAAIPNPLPAVSGENLTNINPKEYNIPGSMPVPSYATNVTFVLAGDFTVTAPNPNNLIFLLGRRLRIKIAGNYAYTEVANAVFAAGITTVTTLDAMPGSPIQEVAVGVITPFALGGAVGATAAGAVSLTKDDTIAGNKTHTGSNTFQERVNAANSTGGTADAITAAFNPAFTALVDKMRVTVRATAANTNTVTFNPDGTGGKLIEKVIGGSRASLVAGDITGANHDLDLMWNSGADRWMLMNPRALILSDVLRLGVGQTWQDVSGSRAVGTVYQNTTGKPIQVAIYYNVPVAGSGGTTNTFKVGTANPPTVVVMSVAPGGSGVPNEFFVYAVIPDQHYYLKEGNSFSTWTELR